MPELLNTLLIGVLRWARSDEGQGITEYALVLALVGLVAVVALTTLGNHVTSVFTTVAHSA